MRRNEVMVAEPGAYRVEGRPARGLLGATYTGRFIDVEGGFKDAIEWRDRHAVDPVDDDEFRKRFANELRDCQRLRGVQAFFRGRRMDGANPSSRCFGPPSKETAPSGRYNRADKPVLYLCSNLAGVSLEVLARPLWAQRFHIPFDDLDVVDLTDLHIESFLAAVFWVAESCRGTDGDEPGYRYTRTVADIVSASREGMLVPGVKGSEEFLYSNLVVFSPHKRWQSWLASERPSKIP